MNATKSIFALSLSFGVLSLAAAACEGEPPKSAESAIGALPAFVAATQPSDDAGGQSEPSTAACACPCQASPAASAAAEAGAPVALAFDAGDSDASVAQAAPAVGDIVGDVVTTPGWLKTASIVYLADAPKVAGRGMSARMDNHGMAFVPLVQVVTEGGSVSFGDSDPFPHNVFSPDHERFDLGQVQPGNSMSHRFGHAGVYTLLCNLHPNMIGYVVVSPSSYFAKADGRGHYRIRDVPLGKYSIVAWAPRLPIVTESVVLSGAEANVHFELHR